MKKHFRFLFCIAFVFALTCVFASNSWASPLEFWNFGETSANVGYYAEIGETVEDYPGDIPTQGTYSAHDERYIDGILCCGGEAWRTLHETWDLGIQLTDLGFTIFGNMTLTTSYDYSPGNEPDYLGFAYAYSYVGGTYIVGGVSLTGTGLGPIGTVVPFTIQIETSGTPWAKSDWELKVGDVTVNQDNYDQQIFNLLVGEEYEILFKPGTDPDGEISGFQTQSLVDGSLESFFNLNFVQVTPVPIPGAIWLLGSGLAGLIGLRRKYFS